jgi:hypothetical protein
LSQFHCFCWFSWCPLLNHPIHTVTLILKLSISVPVSNRSVKRFNSTNWNQLLNENWSFLTWPVDTWFCTIKTQNKVTFLCIVAIAIWTRSSLGIYSNRCTITQAWNLNAEHYKDGNSNTIVDGHLQQSARKCEL